MAEFRVWEPGQSSEDDCSPITSFKRYSWDDARPLADDDFEQAAEAWAKNQDRGDMGSEVQIIAMNAETREFKVFDVENDCCDISVWEANDKTQQAWLVALALHAWHRWADDVRPRPYNWREVFWARDNPEAAAQKKADAAARRFRNIDGKCPWPTGEAPKSWALVEWPGWVPAEVRVRTERWDRTPASWEENFSHNPRHPRFGEVVTLPTFDHEAVTGRYVPQPNDQGYVVQNDGTFPMVSNYLYGKPIEEILAKVAEGQEKRRAETLRRQLEKAAAKADSSRLAVALQALEVVAHA